MWILELKAVTRTSYISKVKSYNKPEVFKFLTLYTTIHHENFTYLLSGHKEPYFPNEQYVTPFTSTHVHQNED